MNTKKRIIALSVVINPFIAMHGPVSDCTAMA